MLTLKRLSHFAQPLRDKTARMPLALAMSLVAVLAAQCAADDKTAIAAHPRGAAAGGGTLSPASPTIVSEMPVPAAGAATIVRRAMFGPIVGPIRTDVAIADSLAGMTIAGSVRIGRATFVVVRGPGDQTTTVPLGGRIGSWRLSGVSSTAASLRRKDDRQTIMFGAVGASSVSTSGVEGNPS